MPFKWRKKARLSDKGEILEIKAHLRDPAAEKDVTKRREALKRVIAFITLGVDTTALAPDVILAAATKDLVSKKMVYFYMAAHAEASPEIALMAINTLQKDCRDESPLVRGLALRTISSLRIPGVVEHLTPPIQKAFSDVNPYVKKTVIMASLKLFRMDRPQYDALALTEKISALLRDADPSVSCAAIYALEEVLAEDGGIVLTKHLVYFLLNRRDFTEWQQCAVLQLILRYQVEGDEEMFSIMNRLEERLRGSNAALILATARVFFTLTASHPTLYRQVFQRLKDPLLTLFATATTETAFGLLAHLKLLISKEPSVFADSYKDFYVRSTDPTYLKELKMETLVAVANDATVGAIVEEIAAYSNDLCPEMCRKGIRSLGAIAVRVPAAVPAVAEHLHDHLETDIAHIRSEAFIVLRDLMRKYHTTAAMAPFTALIPTAGKHVDEPEAKVAFIWLLGEFATSIPQAPYMLEDMVATWNEPGSAPAVQLELLCATMKCFFKRAPETVATLGRLLGAILEDDDVDVSLRERAALYYRLLESNPATAEKVLVSSARLAGGSTGGVFSDDFDVELQDKLFEEFNSLSVVYGMPSHRFVIKGPGVLGADSDDDDPDAADEDDAADADDQDDQEGALMTDGADGAIGARAGKAAKAKVVLSSEPVIDEAAFSNLWGALPVVETISAALKAQPPLELLEGTLSRNNILCLAGGTPDGVLKAYFYAQSVSGLGNPYFLTEVVVLASGELTASVKANAEGAAAFAALFKEAIVRYQ